MIYLKKFKLLDEYQEHSIVFYEEKRNIFNTYYPIGLFSMKDFSDVEFANITIFYGEMDLVKLLCSILFRKN